MEESDLWRVQLGYDDNYADDSFLENLVMNANVMKRDLFKVMLDSVSISQNLYIAALVVIVWMQTLHSIIDETSLLRRLSSWLRLFDNLAHNEPTFLQLLLHYLLKVSFFITGLYILAPIYHTLTRSITMCALSVSLLLIHLFLHDYSGYMIRPSEAHSIPTLSNNICLNSSIIASRLPSRIRVFSVMLFSLQVFLFAPLVNFSIKKYSFKLYLWFFFTLVSMTLNIINVMHLMLFVLFLALLVFISVVCPYWLIRIQEYKLEINGP